MPSVTSSSALEEREDRFVIVCIKQTLKWKKLIKSSGARWDPEEKEWYYPKNMYPSSEKIQKHFDQEVFEPMNKKLKKSAKKAVKTKEEKSYYKENKELVDRLYETMKRSWVCIPYDGYCTHCKKSWAKKLLESFKNSPPEDHKNELLDIICCPCCSKNWDD
jgi:hypothetical protein